MVGQPTVISTFAGCGGSSLGYHLAGFRELLAVEWEAHAVSVFKANFPTIPVYHGDIAKLSVQMALDLAQINPGELTVFDGSPPCQGFSTAGARRLTDPRNSLFREFVRLLEGLKPKAFVMENVTGMVKGVMSQVYLTCIGDLRSIGYRCRGEILNADRFNVPQSRQRVIIIGIRNDLGIEPSHPKPQTRRIGLREAIGLKRGASPPRCLGKATSGVKNKQFENKWRSLDLPCVTLEKTRPPVLLIDGQERDLTLEECATIASFPPTFKWGSDRRAAYQRIGNCVPPNLMRAVAEHIRTLLERKA